MPKQKGVFKVKGLLDDFSFYRSSKDGYLLRMKGGVDANRIKNDPAFVRTRENGSEFGRAAKTGKLIRSALRKLVSKAKDGRSTSRMVKLLMQVIKSDSSNPRGERQAQDGDLSLLTGFDFNVEAQLSSNILFLFSVAADRATGEVTISLPEYVPTEDIAVPQEATHMKLLYGSAEIDHPAVSYVSDLQEESWHVIDNNAIAAADLTLNVTAGSSLPIYTALGVEYGLEVNGQIYPLNNGSFNALSIVAIDV